MTMDRPPLPPVSSPPSPPPPPSTPHRSTTLDTVTNHEPPPPDMSHSASSTILTFTVETQGIAMYLQLLASATVYDLVSLICAEYLNAYRHGDGGVARHLWDITDMYTLKVYRVVEPPQLLDGDTDVARSSLAHSSSLLSLTLHKGAEYRLNYDYSTSTVVNITFISHTTYMRPLTNFVPRRIYPCPPPGYEPFIPPPGAPNMNDVFPSLNALLFGSERSEQGSPCMMLFQPGKRRVQAFISNLDRMGTNQMIWAPEKFESVDNLLHAIDEAVRRRDLSQTNPWASTAVFPRNTHSPKYEKYKDGVISKGFKFIGTNREEFARTFPNCSVAAGYCNLPAKKRRWMVYENNLLTVCTGSTRPTKWGSGPEEFRIRGGYMPADETCIIGHVAKKFSSLNELFCSLEGLMSLGLGR